MRDIASYRLLVAIEAALALCYRVSSRRLRTTPEDYAGCFGLLGAAGIVAPDLTERLQNMARFRNPLVHVYWEVDCRRVHAVMQENLADLRAFAAAVVALLWSRTIDRGEPEDAGTGALTEYRSVR